MKLQSSCNNRIKQSSIQKINKSITSSFSMVNFQGLNSKNTQYSSNGAHAKLEFYNFIKLIIHHLVSHAIMIAIKFWLFNTWNKTKPGIYFKQWLYQWTEIFGRITQSTGMKVEFRHLSIKIMRPCLIFPKKKKKKWKFQIVNFLFYTDKVVK